MDGIYRKPLHLSVASMQMKEFNLKNELRMLKTALIYGDKVDIRSLASSLIILPAFLAALPREEVYKMFPAEEAERHISIAKKYWEYEGVREFVKIFTQHQDIVKFIMFGGEDENLELEDSMIADFIYQLSEEFFSGNTIPFFDEAASFWANRAIETGNINVRKTSELQSKQISIVSNLMSRLPLFEKASVEEIFDIRKELEGPLVNFRSEIIKISKEIETVPWNTDFPSDVEQLFMEKCEPTIIEIEDACKSNKLLLSVISNFSKKPLVLPATSALGLVVSTSTQIPNMLAQAISLTTGSAIIASEAIKEWKEKQRGIEKNGFYFYYKLGKKFSQPRKTVAQSLKDFFHFLRRFF